MVKLTVETLTLVTEYQDFKAEKAHIVMSYSDSEQFRGTSVTLKIAKDSKVSTNVCDFEAVC